MSRQQFQETLEELDLYLPQQIVHSFPHIDHENNYLQLSVGLYFYTFC